MTMAEPTTSAAPEEDCEWCGEAAWRFRCARCDPRREKRLCLDCAKRWHARGFSREHQLQDRAGTTRSYLEWHVLVQTATETASAGSVEPAKPPVGKSLLGGDVSPSASADKADERHVDSVVEETEASHEEQNDASIEFGAGSDHGDAQADQDTEVAQEIPAQLSEETQLELEEVLNRVPSADRAILEALADHIHDMIRLEDAILCHQHTQCEAPACQSILTHQRHVLERKECAIPTCQGIASYLTHMEFCNRRACPFCVRIKQRRLFGKKQALDQLIQNQRRQIQTLRRDGSDQARVNFMEHHIRALERKKNRATEEVETLNRLVVDERLPIFNFPRFSWHVTPEPVIKEEPVRDEADGTSERVEAAQSSTTRQDSTAAAGKQEDSGADVPGAHRNAADEENKESPHSDQFEQEDYVSGLLAKKNSGDEAAKVVFEESVQLAFRIVDASFCSPSKASRCLLGCQKILVHLQHHVDLCVCTHNMCETVEQHFSHISNCQNEGTHATCEYCIRITERECARSVDMMEAEQPETEFKIQRLINAITDSLANDPHDEREQNIMQLEDELQQAEDYKKALAAKLDAARMNLIKARRRMKRHADNLPNSHATGLPLHWTKPSRVSSPPSSSKRRRG